MYLNTIKPAEGSKKNSKRVGRGESSGLGKTSGRGHKGQKARSGGFHKVGFEGGQMPLQRRLPKFGFASLTKSQTAEIRLHELAKVTADIIDIHTLREASLINVGHKYAKVILSGELTKAVKLKGIAATKGAREAIEKVGGSIEE